MASRRSLGWTNLLHAYALIEAVIGLAGFAFPPLSLGMTAFTLDTLLPRLGNDAAAVGFKWLSGTVLILPQSVLRGMDLSADVGRADPS